MTNTKTYYVEMREECGGDKTIEIEATTLEEACKIAKAKLKDWVRGGDYGNDGASVNAYFVITDDEGGELDNGSVTVEIEPGHEVLIEKECHGHEYCGNDPDDHDWTSEGEGGCDQNPGVWSTGGTSMTFASHCRTCGLHRTEYSTGSQRNPGEHDTVEYEMPETWCEECQDVKCRHQPDAASEV